MLVAVPLRLGHCSLWPSFAGSSASSNFGGQGQNGGNHLPQINRALLGFCGGLVILLKSYYIMRVSTSRLIVQSFKYGSCQKILVKLSMGRLE